MAFRKPFRAIPIREGRAHRERREGRAKRGFIAKGLQWSAIAILVGGTTGYLTSTGDNGRSRGFTLYGRIAAAVAQREQSGSAQVYYRNCTQARAAGSAPIYAGQPGYRPALDADGDGIACEPWFDRDGDT
jgi:hypothetical protein